MQRYSRPNAFTLIELLVVVAIIVALLAILLPSMGKAIAITQSAACLSNQRQMQVANINYLADHLNQMIPLTTATIGENGGTWLHLMLDDYHTTPEVRFCPTTERTSNGIFGARLNAWTHNGASSSYCANAWVFGTDNAQTYGHPAAKHFASPIRARNPATTPVIFDGIWFGAYPYSDASGTDAVWSHEWGSSLIFHHEINRMVLARHPGNASNGVFADGHAESVFVGDMWGLTWNTTYQPLSTQTINWID